MKKILITLLSVILLSGCGMFNRGNYEKDRGGFVISGDLIVNYHTNSIGEIDIFMIDQIMSFFEALEYTSFDTDQLFSNETLSSSVSISELASCGITTTYPIPRFLRIGSDSYFYNVRENGSSNVAWMSVLAVSALPTPFAVSYCGSVIPSFRR